MVQTDLICPLNSCPYFEMFVDEEEVVNNNCTFSQNYIFFDIETMQSTGEHIPNLIVVMYFDGTKYFFKNMNNFCEWLISVEHRKYTVISQYGRAFDSIFILQYLLKNSIKPKVICRGTKLISLKIPSINMTIIDAHCFVPTALSNYPSTFGLNSMVRGYFPHLFNSPENQNYIGEIPAIEYYGCDTMKPKDRDTFSKWHAERVNENYIFNLQKELLEYCTLDVDLLRQGCLKLREQFLEIENIDPYRYLTLPSVCVAIYRSRYLKQKSIAVFNKMFDKEQYSKISISWLESLPNASNIQTAIRGGEEKICGARVDGYDPVNRIVYQFHGYVFLAFFLPGTYYNIFLT